MTHNPQLGKNVKVCFLMARPRSGTTVFRHFLNSHPEIHVFGEIFNADYPLNYHKFLEDKVRNEFWTLSPRHSESNFIAYLEHLWEEAILREPKTKIILLDVKFEQAHHVAAHWQKLFRHPYLFDIIRSHNFYLIHLVRRNHLRREVSDAVMHARNKASVGRKKWYHVTKERALAGVLQVVPPVTISIGRGGDADDRLLQRYTAQDKELEEIKNYFKQCPNYIELDYSFLFDSSGAEQKFSDNLITSMCSYFGIKDQFTSSPRLARTTDMRLETILENYSSVSKELRGTKYEWFLDESELS